MQEQRSPTRFFSFAHTIRSLWASTCSWTLLSCRPPPVCARSPQPAVVALAHTSAPRTHRARQQGSGRALSRSIRSPHTPLLRSHTARLHARPQLPAWPLPQRRTAEADPRHPLLHFNTALTSTLPHTHGPPLRTACPPFAPAMAPIGLPHTLPCRLYLCHARPYARRSHHGGTPVRAGLVPPPPSPLPSPCL
jgi:hypothetical protein